MKRTLFLIIWFLCFTLFSGVTFGAAPVCLPPPIMIDLGAQQQALSQVAKSRYEQCKTARIAQKEASITDFVCPSGNFSEADRPHADEIIAYQIAVATVFQAIDTNSMLYAQSLHCNRDTDPIKWQQTIKIFTDSNSGYAAKYYSACNISYIVSLLNTIWQDGQLIFDTIQTSDTFPQYCEYLASRKVDALHNLGILLASNGVGKWFQNDKDIFINAVKTKYSNLLDKVSNYLRVVGRAVKKLDKYTTNPIQGY